MISSAIIITLKLALVTTCLLLLVGTPLAWWLARTKWKGKPIVEALVTLPMILPPTVLGFYLLLALGPHGPLGRVSLFLTGQTLAFTFVGLVIGSTIYSLPFVVQPLHNSFKSINPSLLEAAALMNASPLDRFISVVIPLARPGFLTATILGFSHTVGEFGVVLMIGGNIPGKTKVLSIAIYDYVENLEYAVAHGVSALLLLVSFLLLLIVFVVNKRSQVTP
jgi:molybdate transport system permease protein